MFCLWILQCWLLGTGWMGGKESLFLQTAPPSGREKGNSERKESEQSQGPLPEPRQRHSCSTHTPAPDSHQDGLRKLMVLYNRRMHRTQNMSSLHKVQSNLKLLKHVKMFQSNSFLHGTCAACLSNTNIYFSPSLMIYKEQYLDRNILPGTMLCCYT